MNLYPPEPEVFETLFFLIEPQLRKEISEHGKIVKIPNGEILIRAGQYLDALPIVLEGSIRVFQQSEDREILLYYVNPSNTCMMSLSACFFNNPSSSFAVTEDESILLNIPSIFISDWQRKYKSWNEFIIRTFKNRYDELLNAYESISFDNMDKRIIDYLKTYSKKNNTKIIPISHQKLANELGTTRVVVSRILKQFERNNKLALQRRSIEIL